MLKRILAIFFSLFFLLSAVGIYIALTTTRFTPAIVHKIVKENFPQVTLESFQVKTQKFHFPHKLDFQGIRCVLKQQEETYTIEIQDLKTQGLLTSWLPKSTIDLTLNGLQLASDKIKVKNLSADLQIERTAGQFSQLKGNAKFEGGRYEPYEIDRAAFIIKGREKNVVLEDFSAEAYNAKFTGEILLEYPPSLFYSIQLVFKDLDVRHLKPIAVALPAQIEGVFSGTLSAEGKQSDLSRLDFKIHVVEKGKIRASLLNFVTQYIPASRERENLENILKIDGKVNMERASVELKSVTQNKLTAMIKLFSRELNLDQNFVVDINSDGKLTTLLEYLDRFSVK